MKHKKCNKCSKELILGKNWLKCRKEKRYYICNPCFNFYVKERLDYKKARTTDRKNLKIGHKLSRKVTNFIQDTVKRSLELEATFEQIAKIMQKPCYYCGEKDEYCGIDRKNSFKSYTMRNIVPCCKHCNWAKRQKSVSDYVNHCEKVVNYMRSK